MEKTQIWILIVVSWVSLGGATLFIGLPFKIFNDGDIFMSICAAMIMWPVGLTLAFIAIVAAMEAVNEAKKP